MSMNYETRDDGFDHDDYEDDADHFSCIGTHSMMNSGKLPHGVSMTPKIPPSFNARTNLFQYEQQVREWAGTCSILLEKQGPMLKSALYDVAEVYKELFDVASLKNA